MPRCRVFEQDRPVELSVLLSERESTFRCRKKRESCVLFQGKTMLYIFLNYLSYFFSGTVGNSASKVLLRSLERDVVSFFFFKKNNKTTKKNKTTNKSL